MKCLVCKTGRLGQSGSHLYCDNCGFTQFIMTDDYLDIAENLLAILVSNTRFDNEEALAHVVVQHITNHIPKLDYWLVSITNGKAEVLGGILEDIKQRAINLQINQETLNPETAEQQLRCQCGSDDFHMNKIGQLFCKGCGAEYNFDEDKGLYMPYFLCECGCAAYEELPDNSGLCACIGCGKLYMHGKDHVFRRLE